MNTFFQLIAYCLIFTLVFLELIFQKRTKNYAKTESLKPPEAPGAWPIIGHLHQLLGGNNKLFHRTLGAMADETGSFFTVRLGSRVAFVVNSWEVAHECFTVNDRALASRPVTSAHKHLCHNNTIFGFAPYSPLWRDMRKIATLELLTARRLELLKHVRIKEIDTTIVELYDSWKNKTRPGPLLIDLQQLFGKLTLNVIVRMLVGKRYPNSDDDEARRLVKEVAQFFHLFGLSDFADQLPGVIRWLDFMGLEKEMKKTSKELYDIVDGWLEEHLQQRKASCQEIKGENTKDFMDVMLSLKEKGELSNFPCDPDTLIKSTCMNLLLGGNDTTTGIMTWTIALLLNNRHALEKVQEELDVHIGLNQVVNESDIENLIFLQAVIKETMRLYPIAPLAASREAKDDCTVVGFHVPRGSKVIFNLWKIQRDPKVWRNPSMFLPERFLTDHAHVDLKSQNTELVVFGGGRRSCPGALFGIQVIHLTLARLIQAFEIETPLGEPVDLTERPGLTTPKVTPLEVLLTPRLQPKLYCFN